MDVRQILLRFAVVGALAVLGFLAFTTTSSTPSAEALPRLQPQCSFEIPLPVFIADGGGTNTVTCNFTFRGQAHTLEVDFTWDSAARPRLSIDGCTLDLQTIHVGPCP